MEKPIVLVENLGKRYLLGAGGGERYRALRDVIASSIKNIFNKKKKDKNSQEIWALKDINFNIRSGEKVGVIGRNGAGKSTLLKILSEITEPTEGEVYIRGRIASILEIGTGFHPELTGKENIFMNGAIMGMTHAEIKRKFDEIIGFAEIEKFLDTPVKRYSSGMYVRLAFSVAAHLEPEILIVDEVLAVGDMAFQNKCLGKMKDIGRGGRTVLFVSHNMGAIRNLCENTIWLDKGRLVKKGTTEEVVGAYLRNQIKLFNKSSYLAERDLREIKNKSFYFSRVEMLNAKKEKTNVFSYNDDLVLIVSLEGSLNERFSVEFHIYNELEQLVAIGASGAYHGIYFNKDTKKVRIKIGPLNLTSGKYAVLLSLIKGVDGAGITRIDTWENASAFTIVECKPFKTPWEIPTSREGVCVIQQSFSRVDS